MCTHTELLIRGPGRYCGYCQYLKGHMAAMPLSRWRLCTLWHPWRTPRLLKPELTLVLGLTTGSTKDLTRLIIRAFLGDADGGMGRPRAEA
jgi:hypothetical protein